MCANSRITTTFGTAIVCVAERQNSSGHASTMSAFSRTIILIASCADSILKGQTASGEKSAFKIKVTLLRSDLAGGVILASFSTAFDCIIASSKNWLPRVDLNHHLLWPEGL